MSLRKLGALTWCLMSLGGTLTSGACRKEHSVPQTSDNTSRGVASATASADTHSASREQPSSDEVTCTPSSGTFCLSDTALSTAEEDNPADLPLASWILFSPRNDSVDIRTIPSAHVRSRVGERPDLMRNISSDGVRRLDIVFDQQSSNTVPYVLRLRQVAPVLPALFRPTGRTATLELSSSRMSDRFSVVPLSMVSTLGERESWTVPFGVHKVLLVSDSLYEVCRMPCSAPDTLKLLPDLRVRTRR